MEKTEMMRLLKSLIPGRNVLHLTHIHGVIMEVEAMETTSGKECFLIRAPGSTILTKNLAVFELPTGVGLPIENDGAICVNSSLWEGEIREM